VVKKQCWATCEKERAMENQCMQDVEDISHILLLSQIQQPLFLPLYFEVFD
jgi:hypothetical protein